MASASPATPSTKETTNYARLCRVLVDVGTCALRDCFDAICTPPTLHTVLAASQSTLHSMRSRRIINATQWGKLFPAISTSVSSKHFDITLLMTLLRNICGLPPPVRGWDTQPAATDVSREADIARVKCFRNNVYAHAEHASVDDATFNKHWKEIRDTLVRLGGVTYQVAIDNLEVCCMDPGMEQHYKELLHQWKIDEDNVKDELKEIGTEIKEVGTDVKKISTSIKEVGTDVKEISSDVKNLTKKLDDLVASAVIPARETNDESNGLKLKEMLNTSLACREKFHENELLTSFCKQCKVCICSKCEQTRHKHHITVDIHQAAEQHKADVEEIVEEMKREITDYEKHVEKTKESFRKSRERIATARIKVMTSVEELMRLLQEHEKAMITSLDIIEEKDQREHAAQLEHFQISMNQLQTHLEWCEGILLRKKSVEILQAHHHLIGRCRGLLNAEKLDIYKPSHVMYAINKENVENVRSAVPAVGYVFVSSTDPLHSVAEGTGLHKGDVGSELTIEVKTKDSGGNQCYDENDKIYVKVQSPSGKELSHMIAPCNDGEYSVTYTPNCAGQHEVMIAVNGEPLTGSPWRFHVTPHPYKPLFSFGSHGKGQGQFRVPCSIAIDDKLGNVAVADRKKVQLFSFEGTYLTEVGVKKLTEPSSVAFTKFSELIVIASDKMFCFNNSFKFVKYVTNKQLKKPRHLTIARDGRMVVCDGGDDTVKVLSCDGSQILINICYREDLLEVVKTPVCAVCHQNMFFVSYQEAGNVKVFNENGDFLYSIGTPEPGDGELFSPGDLAIDRFNNLVVCDRGSSSFPLIFKARIQIFTLDGKFTNTIEEQHTGCTGPCSVAVSSNGQLFVADEDNDRVHVLL